MPVSQNNEKIQIRFWTKKIIFWSKRKCYKFIFGPEILGAFVIFISFYYFNEFIYYKNFNFDNFLQSVLFYWYYNLLKKLFRLFLRISLLIKKF